MTFSLVLGLNSKIQLPKHQYEGGNHKVLEIMLYTQLFRIMRGAHKMK